MLLVGTNFQKWKSASSRRRISLYHQNRQVLDNTHIALDSFVASATLTLKKTRTDVLTIDICCTIYSCTCCFYNFTCTMVMTLTNILVLFCYQRFLTVTAVEQQFIGSDNTGTVPTVWLSQSNAQMYKWEWKKTYSVLKIITHATSILNFHGRVTLTFKIRAQIIHCCKVQL